MNKPKTEGEWGKIKAFFDLETEEGFTLKGFKLVQGINGIFVGFPSQKNTEGDWNDTVWADKELKESLSQLAIDYYGQDIMPTDNNTPSNTDFKEPVTENSTTIDTTESITDDDIPF